MARVVALIGAGRRAPWHCAAYVDCDDVGEVFIAEPNDERRAEMVECWGIIRGDFADYRDLLDVDSIDIVHVCAPAPIRADIARKALETGKDVICDGPAAATSDDFEGLVAAAERAEGRLFICIPHLMIPANRQVSRFIDEGETGDISLGTVLVTGDGVDRMEYHAGWPGMPPDGPPPILADSIHDGLAVLQRWLGEAESISAFSSTMGQVIADCAVTFRTRNGVLGQITASYRAGGDVWREERRLFAENGSLLVRDDSEDELPLLTFVEGMFQSIPVHNPPFIRRHATMEAVWNIVECIESGGDPDVSLEEAGHVMESMEAAAESLQTGCDVDVG